jgi:predicted kinase
MDWNQTNILGISGYQGWTVYPLARPGRVVIHNFVSSTHLCYTALMRRLYVICGTPFSGKTTLAQKLTTKTHSQYVSMDEIMRQRGFDLSQLQPVEEWGRAHHTCVERVDALMSEGVSIVLDDTNYLKGLRDVFRRFASQHQYDITTIYLRISLPELEKRRKNAFRTREKNTLPLSGSHNDESTRFFHLPTRVVLSPIGCLEDSSTGSLIERR